MVAAANGQSLPQAFPLNFAYNLEYSAPSASFSFAFPLENFLFGSYSVTYTAPDGSGSFTQASSVLGGVDPSVSAVTTEYVSSSPGLYIAATTGSLTYYFDVVGPADTNVTLDVQGTFSDSWTANLDPGNWGDVQAVITIFQTPSFSTLDNWGFYDVGDTSGGNTDAIDQTADLLTNTVYAVVIQANTAIFLQDNPANGPFDPTYQDFPASFAAGDYTMSASIDPTISIDPSFQLPGYALEFSPNLLTETVPDAFNTLGLAALTIACLLLWRRLRPLAAQGPPVASGSGGPVGHHFLRGLRR
jgi:hypothetical protein